MGGRVNVETFRNGEINSQPSTLAFTAESFSHPGEKTGHFFSFPSFSSTSPVSVQFQDSFRAGSSTCPTGPSVLECPRMVTLPCRSGFNIVYWTALCPFP